jgi:hypothetical protein
MKDITITITCPQRELLEQLLAYEQNQSNEFILDYQNNGSSLMTALVNTAADRKINCKLLRDKLATASKPLLTTEAVRKALNSQSRWCCSPFSEFEASAIHASLVKGNKIEAIKAVRDFTDCGLKESLETINSVMVAVGL